MNATETTTTTAEALEVPDVWTHNLLVQGSRTAGCTCSHKGSTKIEWASV